MTDKPEPKDAKKDAKEPRPIIHLGMMGDGTEEQNLGERGCWEPFWRGLIDSWCKGGWVGAPDDPLARWRLEMICGSKDHESINDLVTGSGFERRER